MHLFRVNLPTIPAGWRTDTGQRSNLSPGRRGDSGRQLGQSYLTLWRYQHGDWCLKKRLPDDRRGNHEPWWQSRLKRPQRQRPTQKASAPFHCGPDWPGFGMLRLNLLSSLSFKRLRKSRFDNWRQSCPCNPSSGFQSCITGTYLGSDDCVANSRMNWWNSRKV